MKKRKFTKLLILCIILTVVLGFGSNSALGIKLDLQLEESDLPPVELESPDLNLDLPSLELQYPNLKWYKVNYHCNFTPAVPNVVDFNLNNSFVAKPADTFDHPELMYSFVGWSTTPDGDVEYAPGDSFKIPQPKNLTAVIIDYDFDLYAVWRQSQIKPLSYTIKYYANYPDILMLTVPIEDGPYSPGVSITTRGDGTFETPPNYEFAGWSLTKTGTVAYYPTESFIMPASDLKLYGVWSNKPVLNRLDHTAYMQGYPDGTFSPLRNMTRAEAVVMFSRLLTKQMNMGTIYTSIYTDVAQDKWYANAIGYMQQSNVLSTPAPSFRPDVPITRAEFADLAVGFENLTTGSPNFFTDVPSGYPYYDQINYAVARGWLEGYPDKTFRPDSYITRAEVITVVNRVLERYPDYAYIIGHPDTIKNYTDLVPSYWAYFNVMEASVGHYYTKIGMTETWTSLR